MMEDPTIRNEIEAITRSLRKIGIAICLQMLQCPNLKELGKDLKKLSKSEANFEKISERIEETCYHFACNKEKQIFSCNERRCQFIKNDFKTRNQISTELKILVEDIVG